MFAVNTSAIGGSLGLTALVSAVPLIVFFVMLLGFKARAHTSGAVALLASILIAVLGMGMPMPRTAMRMEASRATAPEVWARALKPSSMTKKTMSGTADTSAVRPRLPPIAEVLTANMGSLCSWGGGTGRSPERERLYPQFSRIYW